MLDLAKYSSLLGPLVRYEENKVSLGQAYCAIFS